ncbi:alpha/beta hydrolase [Microlunatus speluncae]|uniref:alpha/beta hydrolase n=1 Tax=Microlunatus speluncae TaxID=2594267 RepID=UPI0012666621|nr:alpha/beta hydrolase family protein [Microlunatus speluncae]
MTAEHRSPSLLHRRLAAELEPRLAFPGGEVAPWQQRARTKITELIGLRELNRAVPVRTTPAVRSHWRRSDQLGTIEKISFESEPGSDLVGYLCLPERGEPPYPTVICLQGHSTGMHLSIGRDFDDERTPIPVEGDRDFALGALRHGFAALCIEQRSFGLRRELDQHHVSEQGCHDAAMHALMLGRTLLGERVFDVDRGLDYLATRDDIDQGRIGLMGNSGGGTVTAYAAAVLDRISFAMPSCAVCTFRDSIMAIYHCADNYVPGILPELELADVIGCFAPKPMVVVAGRDDPIFPLPGVRTCFDAITEIYTAAGAADACRLVIGDGGHRFYEDAGWAALLDLLDATAAR